MYHKKTAFAVLLALVPAAAAADLSVAAGVTGPGTSLSIPLSYSGTEPLSGVQFDLEYDSSAMRVAATPGDVLRAADKDFYLNDLSSGRRRFVCIGLNQNPLPSGVLLNLLIEVSAQAPVGTYSLTLSNLVGADALGNTAPLTGDGAAITVQTGFGSPIQQSGVLNSASLASGPVAPGEIVALLGTAIGPAIAQQSLSSPASTALAGTKVMFDGTPAPLLYAGPNQLNAVVPYEISGKASTQMVIVNNDQAVVASLTLPVASAAPAIFTLDSSGVGPGAILNQDFSINSPLSPAARGSIVAVFATGAGVMNPPALDGQITGDNPPLAALPVSVQIGGISALVLYAGAAPGLVAGALQVNCTVPLDIAPGESVPIELTIGTTVSPVGVTMAVK